MIRPARRANVSFTYSNALGSVPVARKKSLSCPDRIAIGGAGCPARCRVAGRLAGCRCNQQLSYPWLVLFGELGQAVIWDGMGQYAGILSRPSSVPSQN
ncbi:DNA-directed RNA polymerase [Pseudomonas syringae pv. actinidiae]|uniref:DNA-directed RNA polymerase n=1 Tax=Pseudomonas syringae pv. actinidiae TaxID=103796 RepID=A0AAN4Q5I7_PSESF|nr:DNA-directed RNA polymerase [Pseudomonas syringae pv. actinidiae]